MKKNHVLGVLFFSLVFLAPAKSQDINACMQDLSIFAEFAKVKNFKSAFEPWSRVRQECPTINVAVYSYGERILKDFIKNGTPEEIEASKKDLIVLYDEWVQNFP
ncbi:MAG: hypothetical protein P8H51_05245 [Flavobacteriaceae bacterium]|nr:hypothetical protein [Flavobacteriaceae bacterium]